MTQDAQRTPARILIPVWGDRYIELFCSLSLPSLLAAGNIPALAKEFDCTVVFLTLLSDREVFEAQPAFQTLRRICPVDFIDIEDLIAETTYAVTITAAYLRGMKQTGGRMLETYFVYLVSDYLMADGSLRGLSKYIKQGYSGIQAGNFQGIQEGFSDIIAARTDRESHVTAILPRELMSVALKNLHPVTLANHVTSQLYHAEHSNRFFWPVDEHTMLGRFFLMHMLCIRPEVSDFVIGASCDYSFIPELCPSGKIAAILDSDDYLVVELQPLRHEIDHLAPGPVQRDSLASHYAEWTTQQHRRNADYKIVFHARDIPAALTDVEHKSDQFIGALKADLPNPPQPHRGHPYWLGAVAAFTSERQRQNGLDDQELLLALGDFRSASTSVLKLRAAFHLLFGKPPRVFRWHHSWRAYSPILEALKSELRNPQAHIIAISEGRTPFTRWLASHGSRVSNMQVTRFLARGETFLPSDAYDSAFLYFSFDDLARAEGVLGRLVHALRDNGTVHLAIQSQERILLDKLILSTARIPQTGLHIEKVNYVRFSLSSMITIQLINRMLRRMHKRPIISLLAYLPLLAISYLAVFLSNIQRSRPLSSKEMLQSVIITLRKQPS